MTPEKRHRPDDIVLFTDEDSSLYPQPVFLAKTLAEAFGNCLLLDPVGAHRFSAESEPVISAWRRHPGRLGHLVFVLKFWFWVLRFRPKIIIGFNEISLGPLRVAAMLGRKNALIAAYFLEYYEDELADSNSRIRWGHRAVSANSSWLSFVIDCEPERMKRRKWLDPNRLKTFILPNSPPRRAISELHRPNREGPPKIIYAGTYGKLACPENFITALSMIPQAFEANLYLQGNTGDVQRLQALTNRLGLSRKVLFPAPVDRDALYLEYLRSDVGLCFYPYGEGIEVNDAYCCPNKLYEYLAGGLAVLASANPTLKFIESDRIGACVDPNDPRSIVRGIEEILSNRNYVEMGSRARILFETRFSYETAASPILGHLKTSVGNVG